MKIYFTLIALLFVKNIFSQNSCFSRPEFDLHLVQTDSGNIYAPNFDPYLNTYIGCKAPAFDITTITGKKISLSEIKDKVVILNFWFTSCGPCIREFKALNKLVDEFSSQDVEFISFALDEKSKLDTFLIKHQFKYEVVGEAKQIAELYQVETFPFSIVLDKNHSVVKMLHSSRSAHPSEMESYYLIKPFIIEALKK
jgi:thiol-disulfide isomerase/thioredoxin